MTITVVKRNGEREAYDANKINIAIEHASQGLDENITWVTQIASELELTLFDGITTQQLDEAVIQVALAAVTRVVPRFSSFTLSFPIVFAAAVLVAVATLPLYGPLAAHPILLVPYGGAR